MQEIGQQPRKAGGPQKPDKQGIPFSPGGSRRNSPADTLTLGQ